ncbi:unnamed protein product [Adineta ricciae]|uniref:Caspase family p20 domain-containing protein n=1 Tax=Adineta ricciae TaxID=249248 RepID=A0A813S9D7_ADIRI|nr:unnamed protein product [Adineta ricciae]CAF1105415.1 unnamed protein product [Adineta ricciae]
MAATDASVTQRRKLALIISNGNYKRKKNRIDDSMMNGRELMDLLNTIGFEVTLKENLSTSTDIMVEVKNFAEKLKENDIVLFYYCGHGWQVDQQNYLIPTDDTRLDMNTILSLGVPVNRILTRLVNEIGADETPPHLVIFILDCGRPYRLENRERSIDQIVQPQDFHDMDAPRGVLILFTREPNRTIGNNLFAERLLGMRKWKSKGRTIAGGAEDCSGPGSALNRLNCPRGLTFTPKQAIIIADTSNHRILKYNPNDIVGQRIVGQNIPAHHDRALCAPTNAIFHEQLKSYIICDYQNRRVLQWIRKRHARSKVLIENIACYGIAIDHEGHVYISDTEKHEVRRYSDFSKRGVRVAGGDGPEDSLHQLNHPTYLCVDSEKSVYISDSWNNRVMKWKKGARSGIVVAGGNGRGDSCTQLDYPTGLAIDQWCNLYVADHWNHRIMRFRDGALTGDIIIGNKHLPRDDPRQLNGPEGLLIDNDGNIYVADTYNHRVQRFDIKID